MSFLHPAKGDPSGVSPSRGTGGIWGWRLRSLTAVRLSAFALVRGALRVLRRPPVCARLTWPVAVVREDPRGTRGWGAGPRCPETGFPGLVGSFPGAGYSAWTPRSFAGNGLCLTVFPSTRPLVYLDLPQREIV